MRPRNARQRNTIWSYSSAIPYALGVTIVVVVGLLWSLEIIDLSRWGQDSTKGLVAVPVSARALPAHTKLTRDHVWDFTTNELAKVYLRPEKVRPDMKKTLASVFGRVLAQDKAAGYVFIESDFLPEGTRPGLVGGIPPGKRAMRVEVTQVTGLFGLLPGDRFDLVATLPIDAKQAKKALQFGGAYGQQLSLQADLSNWMKQATVRVLVQNGVLIEPVKTRKIPVSSSSLTRGLVTKTKPVQEVVIAVDPQEVAPLTEAMAVKASINCVPRSGHPDDPRNSRTPDSQPWSPFGTKIQGGSSSGNNRIQDHDDTSLTLVETVNGKQGRSFVAVPVGPEN